MYIKHIRIIIGFVFFISFGCYSNDKIEDGIKLINSLQFDKAEKVLSDAKLLTNSRAQFWLAVSQYQNGKRLKAGSSFEKSAELGNPWAMAHLVSDWDNPCGLLGWPCSNDWKSKAVETWKKLADSGDGKAIYALAKYDKPWWYKVPYYRDGKLFDIAKLGLSKGGIAFLTDHSFWYKNKSEYLEYLKKAAMKNYAPAMVEMANFTDLPVHEREEWLKKGMSLGFQGAAKVLAVSYWGGFSGFPKSGSQSYYYGEITKHLGNNSYDNYIYFPVESKTGEKKSVRMVTEEEQKKLDKKAQEFLSKVKPNLFWNENTVDLY